MRRRKRKTGGRRQAAGGRSRRRNPKRKPALGFDEASAKAIKGRVQAMLDAKAAWTAASDDQRDEWAAAVNLPVTQVLKEWPDLDKQLQNYLIKLQPRRRNAPKRAETRRKNPARMGPGAIARQLLARLKNEGIVPQGTEDLEDASGSYADLYSYLVEMDYYFRTVINDMRAEMRHEKWADERRVYARDIKAWDRGLGHIRRAIEQVDRALRGRR